jgi:hypothetical protein
VECSIEKHSHYCIHSFRGSFRGWNLEAAAGAKTFGRNLKLLMILIARVHFDTSTFLTHTVHVTRISLHRPYIPFSVDAGEQCRRSSAPPRPAKRRRLRLLLVVVLLPHQHRLRNLRQNQPTSRPPPRLLPIPRPNRHQSQQPPRSRLLRLPNNRPCDNPSRDNMCDSQIL